MATSLKHVQDAMQGNAPVALTESSFQFPTNLSPESTAPEIAYVVFKLVDKRVRKLNVDGIRHNIVNPKTKQPETIRLIRGAHSIWTTELTEVLKDKDYVGKNRMSLHFEDGICRVPIKEVRTVEFARSNDHNVGRNRNGSGKFDYYEYDAAEESKFRLEKQMNKINTVMEVANMKYESMKKLAFFLGITPTDDLGMPKGEDGIRGELLLKADAQPDTVKRYINSKEVEIAYMVRKAIVEAKIDLGGQSGNALWAGGQGFIAKIPSGKKAYEYLTELAMTNSNEGRQFKEQLESMT